MLLLLQGSPESLLLQEVEAAQQTFRMAFDSLSVALNNAVELGDQAARTRINKELGAMYVAYKQKAIKYIYAHPKSMTLIPVIFHNVTANLPLFSEYSDAILFERVYDSLRTKFSGSPYLVSLMSEIEKRKNLLQHQHHRLPKRNVCVRWICFNCQIQSSWKNHRLVNVPLRQN